VHTQLDAGAHHDEVGRRGGIIAFWVFAVAWIVGIAVYLTHAIVLSSDSINNHVHVWWVARDLWHHGRLPWRFPLLGHGDAYAYPYGFVNWTAAALIWPLFGNWAITLTTVIGVVGCIAATFIAFPELRHGWWAAAVLANSALNEALLFGQQAFAWAAMFLLFGIALWRRGRRGWAAILVGVAQATHPAIVAPIALTVVILYLIFTKDRWAVIRWYALSCVMALPAVWLVFASPGYADTSRADQVVNFWGTLGPRVLIVVLPMFYVVLRRVGWWWLGPVALGLSVAFGISFQIPLNVSAQWRALVTYTTDTKTLDAYLRSSDFRPGATYRVLRGGDGKLGLYHVVRAGGQLDSEMFPESMAIRDFRDVADYEQLLCDRHVDRIIHDNSYDESRHTNERKMIDQLLAGRGQHVRLQLITSGDSLQVYAVDREGCGTTGQ
jgi:hypothetical protein